MNDKYIYEPIDRCACYEPEEEIPAELLEEWRREYEERWGVEPEDTPENRAFYLVEPDGTTYLYIGNTRIKVSEHFAVKGKPMGKLIENVIEYAAGGTPPEKKPAVY